jgi:outer membrane protein TolC
MELRQRNIGVERSTFELVRTKGLNEFKGSVSLSLGVFGDNEKASEVYQSPQTTPAVAISLSIPIWDWGANRARMEASQANLDINSL